MFSRSRVGVCWWGKKVPQFERFPAFIASMMLLIHNHYPTVILFCPAYSHGHFEGTWLSWIILWQLGHLLFTRSKDNSTALSEGFSTLMATPWIQGFNRAYCSCSRPTDAPIVSAKKLHSRVSFPCSEYALGILLSILPTSSTDPQIPPLECRGYCISRGFCFILNYEFKQNEYRQMEGGMSTPSIADHVQRGLQNTTAPSIPSRIIIGHPRVILEAYIAATHPHDKFMHELFFKTQY